MDKTLIEDGNFELIKLFQSVSNESIVEKNAVPPINELLYWWTRKPLVVSRAVILSGTLKNIEKCRQFLNISVDKRSFNNFPNIDSFKNSLSVDPSQIKVLDPFGGGGNLIYEANRMGLNCEALDYNPVSYLIMKCTLEYPSKYPTLLVDDIEKYGQKLIEMTKKELEKFFARDGREGLAYLWVWCIICPYCEQRVPLVNNMWILKTPKKRIGMRFSTVGNHNFRVDLVEGMTEQEGMKFTQKKGKAICINCTNSISNQHLTSDISKRRDRELIVVVTKGIKGKAYELATKNDKNIYNESVTFLDQIWDSYNKINLIPQESPRANRGGDLSQYGISKWYQFYGSRQLLVMLTLLKNIKIIGNEIRDSDKAKVISTYLAILLCKHVFYNCIGVYWHTSRQLIGPALAFRVPRIIYHHAEINPFQTISGSLRSMLDQIKRAIKFSTLVNNSCKVTLGSTLHLCDKMDNVSKFDIVITDPPYMDDVPYAEVSDFFYVWLYRALKDFYPELPSIVPVDEDISISRSRFGNIEVANEFYKKSMSEAFKQINKSLKEDGLLILFFAHSSTEAWDLLLNVLRNSKFRVQSSYAIHTESTANPLSKGKTSFMSSIVIACRKILEENSTYFEDTLPLIEDKIKKMMLDLDIEQMLQLPITDLLIMTYGKVLEQATQYTKLKSYRSDFKPEFENIIKDAREYILKEIVKKMTNRSPTILGQDMSFYLVTKVFYKGLLDSNEAIKVAWAYQINIKDLYSKHIAKKDKGITRLLFFDEIQYEIKPEEIDRNNLHLQLMYLQRLCDQVGVGKINTVLSHSNNFRVQDLKQIIALLVRSYRTRINKKELLNEKEDRELKVLESLDDILKTSSSTKNSLERFIN